MNLALKKNQKNLLICQKIKFLIKINMIIISNNNNLKIKQPKIKTIRVEL